MKRAYMIPLVLLLLVGLAVPVWYTVQGKGAQGEGEASGEPLAVEKPGQPGSAVEEQSSPDGEKAGNDPAEKEQSTEEKAFSGGSEPAPEKESGSASAPSAGKSVGQSSPEGKSTRPSGKGTSIKDSSAKSSPGEEPPLTIPVNLAIVGSGGEIVFKGDRVAVGGRGTVIDTLDAAGIAYETSHQGKFVTSIGGMQNKGMSGWMYQLNDEQIMKSAADVVVKEGDCVIWWYSENVGADPPRWRDL
ncbi:MAG TPA: DUF4430 domain-containing protein [Firmicutes bacterium]|jgi:hypothetical protein|nr:DUF4430 domain-containing protein [Bacillota bacterium]